MSDNLTHPHHLSGTTRTVYLSCNFTRLKVSKTVNKNKNNNNLLRQNIINWYTVVGLVGILSNLGYLIIEDHNTTKKAVGNLGIC